MNSMSSTNENRLQHQAALPRFCRIFTAFSPNLTALKIKISNFELLNYLRITELFAHFLKL